MTPGADTTRERGPLMAEYLTIAQLVTYSGVSERTIRAWLGWPPSQALPCYRPGRKVLIRRSEFDTWFSQYRSRGKPIITTVLRELGLDPERIPPSRKRARLGEQACAR